MFGFVAHLGKLLARATLAFFALLIAIAGIEFVASQILGNATSQRAMLHDLPFIGQRFDSDTWSEAGTYEGLSDSQRVEKELDCARGPMVRDLLQRHLVIDVTTREMTSALLGPKEYDIDIRGQTCEAYYLGWCRGLAPDPDALYVCYADDGTISAVGHTQH